MKILTDKDMKNFGARFAKNLRGGEIIELIGDVGAGKTTFVKGLAQGLKITDDVQSPSFTLSRIYAARDDLTLSHYDFYRLADAGIMSLEIAESVDDARNITVVEWGESVREVLPRSRIVIRINYLPDVGREVVMEIPEKFDYLENSQK